MTRHITIRVDPQIERVDGLCPVCFQPSLLKITLWALNPDGLSPLVVKGPFCDDCEPS